MAGDSPSRELYGVREQAAAAGACQFRNKTLWFSRLAPTALWHADRRASPGGAGREAQSIRLPPDALARSPGTAPLPRPTPAKGPAARAPGSGHDCLARCAALGGDSAARGAPLRLRGRCAPQGVPRRPLGSLAWQAVRTCLSEDVLVTWPVGDPAQAVGDPAKGLQ